MRDVIKYDYLPIMHEDEALPNIEAKIQKSVAQDEAIEAERVQAGLLELYTSLVAKRPNWSFVTSGWDSSPHARQTALEIYGNGELLGTVTREWNYYEIDNFRMERKLEQGRNRRKPKGHSIPAMTKRILKDFRPRNDEEQIVEAMAKSNSDFQEALDKMEYPWIHHRNRYDAKVFTLLVEEWDTHADLLKRAGVPEEVRENYEAYSWRMDNKTRLQPHNLVAVVERDDGSYLISDKMEGIVRVTDTLEGWLRAKVGLLKVAPAGTLIKDVGYYKDSVFRIMKEAGQHDEATT